MKLRQFRDNQAERRREENHKMAVDFERQLNQELIDPRLARKYMTEEMMQKLWFTAVCFGRSMTNSPEELYKIWKGVRKSD